MANDAFALSPISASGTLPSEQDYQAISEAFMETSRGRWFLKEYARRNRNADTALVLEAVARVESIVATQKQEPAPPPAAEFAESMAAIRSAVDEARATASKALAELHHDTALAPARKSLRIILEVAWRLREIGYDSRICDILETQASAIGASHDALASQDAPATVLSSFDLIARKISELTDETAAAPEPAPVALHPVAENVVSLWPSSPTISDAPATEPAEAAAIAVGPLADVSIADTPSASTDEAIVPEATVTPVVQTVEAIAETGMAETGMAETATAETLVASPADATTTAIPDETPANTSMSDAAIAGAGESAVPTAAIEPQPQPVEAAAETAMAETSMAEPEVATTAALPAETQADASTTDTPFASMEEAVVAAAAVASDMQPVEPIAETQASEPADITAAAISVETPADAPIADAVASMDAPVAPAAAIEPSPVQPAEAVAEEPTAAPQAAAEPPVSLGSALIALGMVSTPVIRSDPLAPFRRMSQAERVAFFS